MMAACGGGGGNPAAPGGGSSGGGSAPGPSGATITIGANGAVSPTQVTVAVGQSVTFVNNHNVAHDMVSDPHPTHTNCPSMNAVGRLNAGQTKLTNAFTAAGTCGFHDHDNPETAGLTGRITIQ
jgi:plastocyanin